MSSHVVFHVLTLSFLQQVLLLNKYVRVVLGDFPNVFVGIMLILTVLIKICIWRMVFVLMLRGSISCTIVIRAPF